MREGLLALARGSDLASLLVGLLVTLRDLLTKSVEGRRRGRPSRTRLLNLLRHALHSHRSGRKDWPQEECESAAPKRWNFF